MLKDKEEIDKILEDIYNKLGNIGGDWFILSQKDIDRVFNKIMAATGVYNEETNEFLDGEEWSEVAHINMDIFWKWYIYILKEKLRITRYYEKHYGNKNVIL